MHSGPWIDWNDCRLKLLMQFYWWISYQKPQREGKQEKVKKER